MDTLTEYVIAKADDTNYPYKCEGGGWVATPLSATLYHNKDKAVAELFALRAEAKGLVSLKLQKVTLTMTDVDISVGD